MTAYITEIPSGVPGDITRSSHALVEPGVLNSAATPDSYGKAVKIVNGKFEKIASGDSASVVYGLLARSVPNVSNTLNQSFGASVPNADIIQGILVQGYMIVECKVGTPVRGGSVYVRITESGTKKVGDFETAADSGSCVALPNVIWAVTGKDSNSCTEIRIK